MSGQSQPLLELVRKSELDYKRQALAGPVPAAQKATSGPHYY